MKLSATGVKALREPGLYSDGNGLHLFISNIGNRSWVQRVTTDRRRRDIGLRGYPTVSLKQARRQATLNRETIANGRDPLAERHRTAVSTFREAAQTLHEANRPRWKNQARCIVAADPRTPRLPEDREHARRCDRPCRRAVSPDSHMDDTPRDRKARPAEDADGVQVGHGHATMESNPAGEAIDGALPSLPKVKAHLRGKVS